MERPTGLQDRAASELLDELADALDELEAIARRVRREALGDRVERLGRTDEELLAVMQEAATITTKPIEYGRSRISYELELAPSSSPNEATARLGGTTYRLRGGRLRDLEYLFASGACKLMRRAHSFSPVEREKTE
jgi:hypothetical protein